MSIGLAASAEHNTAPESQQGFLGAVAVLRALTDSDLEAVNHQILAHMQSSVGLIPDLAGHLVNAGGKRIRPMLTLAAARVFDYEGEDHVKLAAAVELIHGATLLHDDVVDASSLRRGAQTANVIWGNKESVLVGDYLFSRAFELMVAAGDLRVLQILSRASGVIAEGEVLQLATQKNIETTFEQYLEVVDSKTAALFASAAQSGALIAGGDDAQEEAMRCYARNFGVAYQLIDDALDYAGFETSLGKTVGDDFREGKMTLPVVYAVGRAKPDEKAFWRRTISEGRQQPDDFETARTLMDRDDAIADTINCARRYADKALNDLSKVPANDYTVALADLVETSVSRAS
ncbi:MAG: polyprenyl synthetase family protein [Pseudomonadota bacterium]